MKEIKTIEDVKSFTSLHSKECSNGFVVCYYDNKADSKVTIEVVPTVIDSVRRLPALLKATSLPLKDVEIHIIGGISAEYEPFGLGSVIVEPSCYYSELNNDNSVSDDSSSKELEKTDSK